MKVRKQWKWNRVGLFRILGEEEEEVDKGACKRRE